MNIHVYEKKLFLTIVLLILFSTVFVNKTNALVEANVYSNLNTETKSFVARLNQLPQNFIFNNTLIRGSVISPDVQYLKWILNSDKRTALTDNPNMTLLELTSMYGPITEDAVKRFQTIYRSEILDPQGITFATGVVGSATRVKLNSLLTKSRLVANYSNVLNTALVQRLNSSTQYTNATNSDAVDFSYLTPLNLDTIFSYYSKTNMSTGTAEYQLALSSAQSSSDRAIADGNNGNNNGSNSSTDPNAILSTSPAPGILAPHTLIGVTALLSGDFVGANISSYLSGKGTGIAGMKGLVSDYTKTLSGGTIKSSNNDNSSNGAMILGAGAAVAVVGSLVSGTKDVAVKTVVSQFGGKIIMTRTCPCSANYLITLYDLSLKVPLSVIFQPGISTAKLNYNPTIGQSVLGGYTRGTGVCMIYVGSGCSPYGTPWGTIDTVRGIGTTLEGI